jgi:methylmalonyl-CoA/ethylmalonyl-CoA epimerase
MEQHLNLGRNYEFFSEYGYCRNYLNFENRGVKMIKKVDHIGIAVRSLETTLPFYTEVLHLPLLGIEEVESQKVRVAFLKAGETKLELLEPTSEDSPIAKYIEKRGEGIHHVALGVDCIEERIQEMKEKGISMIDSEPRIGAGGAHIAFMHPKSASGVLVELCEKKG